MTDMLSNLAIFLTYGAGAAAIACGAWRVLTH
jgi:hypothetical protein